MYGHLLPVAKETTVPQTRHTMAGKPPRAALVGTFPILTKDFKKLP